MDQYSEYMNNFSPKEIKEYAELMKNWMCAHGAVRGNKRHRHLCNFVPFTLFPTPFPRFLYEQAMAVQKDLQTLYHKASLDHEFICEALEGVIIHDDFIRRLLHIYLQVENEGRKPKAYFDLPRADYMIHQQQGGQQQLQQQQQHRHQQQQQQMQQKQKQSFSKMLELTQIEVNTMSAGLAGVSNLTNNLHQYMLNVFGDKCPYFHHQLPNVNTIKDIGAGMARAWQLYNVDKAIVVFIVGDGSDGRPSRFDQHMVEYAFQDAIKVIGVQHHVPVLFRHLGQIKESSCLSPDGRFMLNDVEVGLVYYRVGYNPGDYVDESCWDARLLMERSIAIKCPNIAMQLIGMVERFIKDSDTVQHIRSTFGTLLPLDFNAEGEAAIVCALNDPGKFVLKPQRENGGNNLYGEDLVKELERTQHTNDRKRYILMDRVCAPTSQNYIVNADMEDPLLTQVVSELGIFGVFISDGNEEIMNMAAGYALRTKVAHYDDGGMASGKVALDTLCLI